MPFGIKRFQDFHSYNIEDSPLWKRGDSGDFDWELELLANALLLIKTTGSVLPTTKVNLPSKSSWA
jgi:hypothetical protein